MTAEEFQRLAAAGYTHIPLLCEVWADLDTPLSVYLKLADAPHSYLLESVHGGERWGRYSIIGLPCRRILRVHGNKIRVETDGVLSEEAEAADPLAWIASYATRYKVAHREELPRFYGGLVGYFGYDAVRYMESRLQASRSPDPLQLPDILLLVSEEVVVFDQLRGCLYVIILADTAAENSYARAQARLSEIVQALQRDAPSCAPSNGEQTISEADFISGFTRAGYEAAVLRAQDYILNGDIMQVVLSQRMSVHLGDVRPLSVYRSLRRLNPSPYMFFFNLDTFHIVGSSPEILVRLEDGVVTVRPIAGTRRRGANADEDQLLEQELLADPKERAEHLMLIDLGRNDLGRVSATGSVALTERMVIERYSHVMHIASNVTGKLDAGLTAMDVLRATFPAGTVSGAPKIRAMELIDELEPIKRGIYAGAIGYISWNGNMDTAIAIRTAVVKDGYLHIQAGAGIVADSIPAREWEETLSKGRAMFRAVALAGSGQPMLNG